MLLAALFCCAPDSVEEASQPGRTPSWTHLSTADGGLPELGPSEQQTGSLVADLDEDGVNDFVITARVVGPSINWYRRTANGWDKYIIDAEFLAIEAGGAYHDIDGDGDLDGDSDILGKPYNWNTPRVDLWLQN